MKCALTNAFLACFGSVALLGCSGSVGGVPAPAPTPGAGDPAPNPTEWPTGHDTGPAGHRPYPIVLVHGFSGFHNIGPINFSAVTGHSDASAHAKLVQILDLDEKKEAASAAEP